MPRIDTVAGALSVAGAMKRTIEVPASVPLEAEDLPFWDEIIAARPVSRWNGHDLHFAALLARAMGQLEIEQRLIRGEGSVITTDKGSPMANPRDRIINGLMAQVRQSRQSLGLHDRGVNGEKRDSEKRAGMERAIEAGLQDVDAEGLLN